MKSCALILTFLAFFCMCHGQSLTEIGDTTQVNALIKLSENFQWVDSYRSLEYADQALVLAQKIGDQKGIAKANNLKGFCFWSFGDNDLAIESAMSALSTGQQENDLSIQAESYYILARGYMDLNERKKSGENLVIAERMSRQAGNWEQLSTIYNLVGVIKFIGGERDSALYYYNKALEMGKHYHISPIQFPRIISNIGECYADDRAKAFSYYNEALSLARETNNRIAEASITDIIGQAYLRDKDLKNAEVNLQLALRLARKLGLRRVIRHAYAGLVDVKLKQGRGDEAVFYLQNYFAVRDSLLNTSKIRQIVELESKHALQLKEQNLKILENEKQIQTLWKNLLIVLVIFVILLSVGIYLSQRYRFRRNRELLNLEIDYLTRQNKETLDKYKASLSNNESDEPLESHDQKLLKRAISIVETHMSDPLFGVEKMAMEMAMSRTNLHRKIKSITGFPPSELIRSIRLRKAAKLILGKVDSVTQIALMTGFDDYSYFSKAFKKHFGVAPSSYEELHSLNSSQVERAPI